MITRTVYERALPKIFVEKNQKLHDENPSLKKYSEANVKHQLSELERLVDKFSELGYNSVYPWSFFGIRFNCGCFKQLFHEKK